MNTKLNLIRDITLALVSSLAFYACKQPSISLSGMAIQRYHHEELGSLPALPGRKTVAAGQVVSMIQDSGQIIPGKIRIETVMAVGDENGPDRICKLRVGTEINISAIVRTTSGETYAIIRIIDPCVRKGESIATAGVFEGYVALDDISFDGLDAAVERPTEQDPQTATQNTPPLETIKKMAASAFTQKAARLENPTSISIAEQKPGETIDATNKSIADIKNLIVADFRGNLGNTIIYNQSGCLAVSQVSGKSLYSMCNSNIKQKAPGSLVPCNVAGESFRNGGGSVALAVFGKASQWRVTPLLGADPNSNFPDTDLKGSLVACFGDPSCKERNRPTDMPSRIIDGKSVAASPNGLSFIPLLKILVNPNNWSGAPNLGSSRARIIIQGQNSAGGNTGGTCLHEFAIISPIVLDLSLSQKPPRTRDGLGEKVDFDLNADGRQEQSGWIYPNMGLLAIDRNDNGKIDDGSELFGEFSDHKSYANGYEALKLLDSDKNNVIDARDRDFAKLLVWVDADMDGQSQSNELHVLSDFEITKLSIDYQSLPNDPKQLNKIRFQAKYFGPKHCAKSGCNSYDIFFGVESSLVSE